MSAQTSNAVVPSHSVLPPSGAAAWRRCPLWVTMNRLYPKPDTPESLEGTAAHWVFGEMWAGREIVEGDLCPNGVYVTGEMIEGAELLCETVRTRTHGHSELVHIESQVQCNYLHPDCWGTPDVWFYISQFPTIELIDYKFGHKFVDEFENDQCVSYLVGILRKLFDWPSKSIPSIDVNITIVQPRCFYKGSSVRTWSTTLGALIDQIGSLRDAAQLAMLPNPAAVTNSECVFCPGRHTCPALQKAAYADAEFAVTSAPVELTPAAASLELKMLERAAERLQSRVEGMREVVMSYARRGERLPWHRIEQGPGRTHWTRPENEIVAMGALLGHDLSKLDVVTPVQARKLGVDEDVIKFYSVPTPGPMKLVPDNPSDARRVFGNS